MVMEISDTDYRSYALPCYPIGAQELEKFIKDLESRVVVEISDKDYHLPEFPYCLFDVQLAA